MSRVAIPSTVPSTDGVTLRLYDLGGEGPLLVLCHATGFCGPLWEPVAAVLGERFQCVSFDFRAHGRSTRSEGPLVWTGMADDVRAVTTALSPGRPVDAVGHSMGGTALVLAETAAPGTIARAWTFEPILFERTEGLSGPQPSPISEGARRRRDTFASADEVLDRYGSRPPLDRLDPRVLALYVEHGFAPGPDGSLTLRCRPEDEAGVFEHHHSGAWEALDRLTVPYLVAVSGDGQRPAETGRAAAARHPGLELAEYPALTHFGPLEEPDRLAADILAWFDR